MAFAFCVNHTVLKKPMRDTLPAPVSKTPPQRSHRRFLRGLLVAVVGLVVGATIGGFWLLATENGLKTSLDWARAWSGGRLEAQGASGRLIGPLALEGLAWSGDASIRLSGLELEWSPAALLEGRLEVTRLKIKRLHLELAAGSQSPPTRLSIPLAFNLAQLELETLDVEGQPAPLLTGLKASLESDGDTHRLKHLEFDAQGFHLQADGKLDGRDTLPLQARLELQGKAAEHPLELTLQADGPLAHLPLQGRLQGAGSSGDFTAIFTPFSAQPMERLQVRLRGIDPSQWQRDAPQANLDLEAELLPWPARERGETPGLVGSFALVNHKPARLEQHGLPLQNLRGGIRWQGTHLELEQLEIRLPGKGSGQGRLTLESAPDQRALRHLEAAGDLVALNPSALDASWPVGDLNGHFQFRLDLAPPETTPAMALEFNLDNSRLAGHRFMSQGRLQVAGTRLSNIDLRLKAGANRATLKGALGQPHDALQVDIQAARLEELDLSRYLEGRLEGDLEAQLRFSGALRAPSVSGTIKSRRLLWPGQVELRNLALEIDMGIGDDAPLEARLDLENLESPQGRLSNSILSLRGKRQQHQIQMETSPRLPQKEAPRLRLGASGKFGGRDWSGTVETLSLAFPDQPALLQLMAPASLTLGEDYFALEAAKWHGRAQGGDWQAQLNHLEYRDKLWTGQVKARMEEIDWIAPLLGNNYQLGGSLEADLTLAGTVEQPRFQGHLAGDRLRFHALDWGLRLESGQLRLSFDENRLNLEQFAFDAPHSSRSRVLEPSQQARLETLVQHPGRLEGHGILLFRESENTIGGGQLEFQAQRLGVAQKPDQWMLLSGQGQLRLEDEEAKLDAQLKIEGGYWRLADLSAPRLSDDVYVMRTAQEPPAPAARPFHTRVEVDVDLGPSFHFSGAGVSSRLAGAFHIQGNGQEPLRATGGIRAEEGHFDAYGQQLEIEQGILTFNGLVQNPGLNIRAMRKHQAVEAGVSITGVARKPLIRLVSTPNVPDVEKLSWLVLGKAPEQGGADLSTLLAAASAILGGQDEGPGSALFKLQQALGVNVRVRSGSVGHSNGPVATSQVANTSGFGGSSGSVAAGQVLEVGTRLASGLNLSYEQSLDGVESVVKLTFALTRNLSLIGQAGTDNALDVFYNFRLDDDSASPDALTHHAP
jgi:translocation and assembly module TamB